MFKCLGCNSIYEKGKVWKQDNCGEECPTCGLPTVTNGIPQRRFELMLSLGADSWEELLNALEQVLQDFEREGQVANRVSGGARSGHWHTLIEHPSVTPESYQEAVKLNRKARLEIGKALT